jgi:hypothetical protein
MADVAAPAAAPRPWHLAVLPNGEAVRPDEVRRVLIEPAASLLQEEGERFAVLVVLADGDRRAVGTGLTRPDAAELGRRCARAVNDALKGAPG